MGTRFAKRKNKHQTARLLADSRNGELVLVGKGARAYLWSGETRDGTYNGVVTFTGQVTLRKLARLILQTIPERKR